LQGLFCASGAPGRHFTTITGSTKLGVQEVSFLSPGIYNRQF